MKAGIPILILTLITNLCAIDSTGALEPFRWQHRIILVAAPAKDADRIRKEMEADKAAVKERHILWFVVAAGQLLTNYSARLPEDFSSKIIRSYLPEVGEGTGVCLIGKDGGVKTRQAKLDLKALYARIDSMPMRQAEMRQNRERDDSSSFK